jgi:hypothetical protein
MRPDFYVDMNLDVFHAPRPCPKCNSTKTRVMTFSEQTKAWHWFLRCGACSHEWTLAKHEKAARVTPVAHA